VFLLVVVRDRPHLSTAQEPGSARPIRPGPGIGREDDEAWPCGWRRTD